MRRGIFLLSSLFLTAGCITVKFDQDKPLEVHVAVDVKVDKALDSFFGDLDKKSTTITTPIPNP